MDCHALDSLLGSLQPGVALLYRPVGRTIAKAPKLPKVRYHVETIDYRRDPRLDSVQRHRDEREAVQATERSQAERLSVGTWARAQRERLGWRQRDVADALGVEAITVSRYERGQNPVCADRLAQLEDLFGERYVAPDECRRAAGGGMQ